MSTIPCFCALDSVSIDSRPLPANPLCQEAFQNVYIPGYWVMTRGFRRKAALFKGKTPGHPPFRGVQRLDGTRRHRR